MSEIKITDLVRIHSYCLPDSCRFPSPHQPLPNVWRVVHSAMTSKGVAYTLINYVDWMDKRYRFTHEIYYLNSHDQRLIEAGNLLM